MNTRYQKSTDEQNPWSNWKEKKERERVPGEKAAIVEVIGEKGEVEGGRGEDEEGIVEMKWREVWGVEKKNQVRTQGSRTKYKQEKLLLAHVLSSSFNGSQILKELVPF